MSVTSTYPLPKLVGHRGAAALAPENTLVGFRAAAAAGVTGVEFDVRLSADGVPVVIHDATLERTTSGKGPVAAQTAATLGALDAGAWFAPRFKGERLPTLEATIGVLRELGLAANIELKSEGDGARALARAVAAVVARAWPADRAPPILSSFDAGCVAACREFAPDVPRAFLVEAPDRKALATARTLDCVAIHANQRRLNQKLTTMVKNDGWRCAAYTVDDPARARRLLAWGVDCVITNAPDRLKAALGDAL
ncbi:MAG TPA: glycerophosphodiester phosphodiesterase [Alphaproteobacteria bacterium]|jgi:glycerophosphoryl diester phosphodiesterase|nr:glycerophosphodiester phosphodiesterase [Alphaproteobacteria bacterium]